MKKLCMLLVLLLLLGATACASGEPAQTTAAAQPSAPETTAPRSEAIYVPDFTVQTIDGGSFTLSEALKTHELVLINLFATWCPPCAMEFPYLQEAWSQRSGQVSVLALSVEETDSAEVLRDYADEKGLTFPIGSASGTELGSFVTEGIPTTVLIDRSGRVAAVEIGAKSSTQAFLELFDGYTGESYDPALCSYTVIAYGSVNYEGVAGAVVNFCTDTSCTPVTTGEDGAAVFTGPPAKYHVQLVKLPEGMEAGGAVDFYTEPYNQVFWLPITEVSE